MKVRGEINEMRSLCWVLQPTDPLYMYSQTFACCSGAGRKILLVKRQKERGREEGRMGGKLRPGCQGSSIA